jgi:hypothetical protein
MRPAAQLLVEFVEGDQVAGGGEDRVGAEVGARAVGGDAGDGDLGPDEPAVGSADLPLGGLGYHGGIDAGRVEPGEHLLDAQAGQLLVGNGSHDDLSVDAGQGGVPAGSESGGEAGLRVVGTAGVEPVAVDTGRQRVAGAGQTNGVEVAAQQ